MATYRKPGPYSKPSGRKMSPSVSFSDQVLREARALGFDAAGIARAGPSVKLDRDFEAYESFVREGMNGEMQWLGDPELVAVRERLDGESILRGARSIVCVARRYGPGKEDEEGAARTAGGISAHVARYARGRDYHRFLRRRIRRLATFIRSLGTPEQPVRARPLCDEEPILERAWAVRAGLGFVGKNGMLIVPGLGSMVLLGEIVTTLELDGPPRARDRASLESPPPRLASLGRDRTLDGSESTTDRCGACTRCLDACPTSAFVRPFVLDPRRCVSYLTIEHESAIASEFRVGVGEHLFGCDDCQTVCPFNAGVGARALLSQDDGDPFAPLERWSRVRLQDLLSMDAAGWRAVSEGTPVRRAGKIGLARNAAIVLGNRRDASALGPLREAASAHPDPIVREAAAWAVARIERA
jgi:epoxyqueuosine reductase